MGPFTAGIDAAAWTLMGLMNAMRHTKPRKAPVTRDTFVSFIVKPPFSQDIVDVKRTPSVRGDKPGGGGFQHPMITKETTPP
jgi:hypothetical protein